MPENKKRINAFISLEHYSKITESEESFSDFITKALTYYFSFQDNNEINQDLLQEKEAEIKELKIDNDALIRDNNNLRRELEDQRKRDPENKDIIKEKESRIKDLQEQIKIKDGQQENRIRELQEQIKIMDSQQETRIKDLQGQTKVIDQQQEARISDLKEQIQTLNYQIQKKDKQIEDLNQALLAQASNIYNLTKDNTRLLPESKGNKKWWMFWRN